MSWTDGIGPLSRAITIPASVLTTLPITVTGGAEPSGAAHQGKVGDRLIVMAFAQMDEETARTWVPKVKRF